MKTKRIFAAILSVALCMNFASCSNDDDNENINPDNAKKRLVKVVKKSKGRSTVYDIGYDAEGRVVSIYADNGEWWSWDITYSGNQASAHWKCPGEEDDYVQKWTLDNDGNITRRYYEDYEDWDVKYTYTNGYLTKRVETSNDDEAHSCVAEDTYDWKDGLLVSTNGETEDIVYTDIQNVCSLCVGFDEILDDDDDDLRMAGLCGYSFKKLPKKAYEQTYEYELDSDGYVKTMKVSNTGYSSAAGWSNSTYTLTYEEIK